MGLKSWWNKQKSDRQLRKKGPDIAYYGGSKEANDAYRKEAKGEVKAGKERETDQYKKLQEAADKTSEKERRSESERVGAQMDALSSRQGYQSAVDKIPETTEAAIQAQAKNAQDQLAAKTAMQNRQARGLAGSMGEGGALAMQQAMASAGAGAADALAQNQLQQNQQSADMRFNAMQQQLAGQQNLAGMDQSTYQNASQRQLGLLSAANSAAGGMYDAAAGSLGAARQNQQFIENSALASQQQANQQAYENAKKNNFFGKVVSTVFDPMDFRGSGSKGFGHGGG